MVLDVVCDFFVLLVRYKNRKQVKIDVHCLASRQPPVREMAVHMAVAGDVFDSVLLCPATKSGGILCYTLRTFECLSARPSVRQRLIIRVRSITIPFETI